MGLLHELFQKMYGADNISEEIDATEYINELILRIYESFGIDKNSISCKINIKDVKLNLDTAIPVGLIVNELISNSFKYDFPKKRGTKNEKWEIRVALYQVVEKNYDYALIVRDNGIGLPEGLKNLDKITTLGLRLVNGLAEYQLQGKISIDNTNGTEYTIKFRRLDFKVR